MSGCSCGCTAQHGSAQERRGGVSRHKQKGDPSLGALAQPRSVDLVVDLDLRALSIWAGRWMAGQ